jgi:hypothetical protein
MGSWIVLLPLALLGVLVARGLLRDLGIAALVWMVMIGIVAFGEWRFRVPMLPILVLLAVEAIRVCRRGALRRRHLWAVAIAVLPVVIFWVTEVLERAGDIT